MGIFGNDEEQNARIDALESHIRAVSEAVQQTQLDVMKTKIAMIRLEKMLGDKVSSDEVDPVFATLNEQLGVARDEYDKMSSAAADVWQTLHGGAAESLDALRASVEDAAARVEKELGA